MTQTLTPDLCVIGAGSGGLSVAAAAAQLGVFVVLVEKGKMGGDCLNYGCVPSKAMIAAGKRAQNMRTSAPFGIAPIEPSIDYQGVHDHVRSVIDAIAPMDSVERFRGLGVHVIQDTARFADERTVIAGDTHIRARRTVIATGSSPMVPPIPGLDQVPYFVNETIFDNTQKLEHLIVIGGGPIGMELAQAHRRLGSRVTVVEALTALAKDDPELTALVLKCLEGEGVEILQGTKVTGVRAQDGGIVVSCERDGGPHEVSGSHILVATGRVPNIEQLNLDAAGVAHDRRGITVDERMRTSNKRVYAIGDVAGGLQFTHVANYHAGLVIRNALFRMPVKANNDVLPWVTYTDPELAHVGLDEAEAKRRHDRVNVLRWALAENDRAQAERATEGVVKVITTKKGKILGASIVGEHAGELIQMWSLAISAGMKIKAFTGFVSPYPTLSEINKRVAYTYYAPSLANPWLRRIVRWLAKLG